MAFAVTFATSGTLARSPIFAPSRTSNMASSSRVASNPIRASRTFGFRKVEFGVFALDQLSIQERIQKAIHHARAVAGEKGSSSKEARVAWDEVEELEAELAHQKNIPKPDPLVEFCKEFPEEDECRLYED